MGKIINTNYKHHDSDFHKGFLQGIIAASTNCHSDELTLLKRYITALKSLSSNHNIVISPSDKGGGVVIMDSTVYNQVYVFNCCETETYLHHGLFLHYITSVVIS